MSNRGVNIIDHTQPNPDDDDEHIGQYRIVTVELTRQAKTVLGIDGKPTGGTRQFWERNSAHPPLYDGHPGGEVRVAGDDIVTCAETDAVREAIGRGILREVTGRKQPTPPKVELADLLDQGKIGNFTQKPTGAQELAEAIVEAVRDAKGENAPASTGSGGDTGADASDTGDDSGAPPTTTGTGDEGDEGDEDPASEPRPRARAPRQPRG